MGYKASKKNVEFYITKPDFNKFASSCDVDESIRGLIWEVKSILQLEDIVKTMSKASERNSCTPHTRHQIMIATRMALDIRYDYLNIFINNIKQAVK